jgi:hypothetical protein
LRGKTAELGLTSSPVGSAVKEPENRRLKRKESFFNKLP